MIIYDKSTRLFAVKAFESRPISSKMGKVNGVSYIVIYLDLKSNRVKYRNIRAKSKGEALISFKGTSSFKIRKIGKDRVTPTLAKVFELPREQDAANEYKSRLKSNIKIKNKIKKI